ncbi:MAG: hypothetical protein ABJN26_14915 [Stappiaceae bacterium]
MSDSPQQIASQGKSHFLADTSAWNKIEHLGSVLEAENADLTDKRTLFLSAGLSGTEVALLAALSGEHLKSALGSIRASALSSTRQTEVVCTGEYGAEFLCLIPKRSSGHPDPMAAVSPDLPNWRTAANVSFQVACWNQMFYR